MKHILLICPKYPLPENSGTNMRTMNFVRLFKKIGTVDIAYSNVSPDKNVGNPIFNNEIQMQTVNSSFSFHKKLLRWIEIKNRPFPISKYTNVSENILLSIIKSKDYDYIFVRYLYNTSSLFKLPDKYKARVIIDFDDVLSGSLAESEIANIKGIHRKIMLRLNRRYLRAYEKKCLEFGAVLFCSEKDRSNVAGNRKFNSFVVPNIYHNQSYDNYDFGDGFKNENILLFIGSLGYGPNVQGLQWFVKSVFADFKKKYPHAKLLIVGRSPQNEIKMLCENNTDIELHSNVSDIKDYYRKCKAVIVPLLTGGGTRIKILESAMASRPVLSTPIGAEGLEMSEDKDILLFKNARDFLVQYEALLEEEKYRSLVQNSRHIVVNKYSIYEFNRAMKNVLDAVEDKSKQAFVLSGSGNIHDLIAN